MNTPNATANLHDETTTQVVMVHDGYDEHINSTLSSELQGALKLSNNGMFTTDKPELAAEMMEKYRGHVDVAPWRTTAKPNGRLMFTMPRVPWETEWDRKRKEQQHAREIRESIPQS